MTRAVEAYTGALGDETSFVEGYENLNVYTKLGKYQDTYVAFVRYDMKIRDVYTGVPGLGTLYVTEDEDGKCQVETQVEEDEIPRSCRGGHRPMRMCRLCLQRRRMLTGRLSSQMHCLRRLCWI